VKTAVISYYLLLIQQILVDDKKNFIEDYLFNPNPSCNFEELWTQVQSIHADAMECRHRLKDEMAWYDPVASVLALGIRQAKAARLQVIRMYLVSVLKPAQILRMLIILDN
jgi:hypothetical protein